MTGAEYETEDPLEAWVADAEALLDQDDETGARIAAELGWSMDEYRRWRQQKIFDYRGIDPDSLTPDLYRRLFRQEPPR